jgi:hypothetical protein
MAYGRTRLRPDLRLVLLFGQGIKDAGIRINP